MTRPYVTYALLAANLALFALVVITSPGFDPITGAGRTPLLLIQYGVRPPSIASGETWRLLTAGFLHVSLMHVAFNSYALYQVGSFCEPRFGAVRFGVVYLIALLAGDLAADLTSARGTITVGASGAIMGTFGAMAVVGLRYPSQRGALQGALLPIVLTVFYGISNSGISNAAHVGGVCAGAMAARVIGVSPEIHGRLRAFERGPNLPADRPDDQTAAKTS